MKTKKPKKVNAPRTYTFTDKEVNFICDGTERALALLATLEAAYSGGQSPLLCYVPEAAHAIFDVVKSVQTVATEKNWDGWEAA